MSVIAFYAFAGDWAVRPSVRDILQIVNNISYKRLSKFNQITS